MTDFSPEAIRIFHLIYNNNQENLKSVVPKLLEEGLSHIDIIKLTQQELNLKLGEALNYLSIPDYVE